jgi:small subunit ribosomal protein S2
MIDLKALVKAGVQFGHQTWRWCPKMSPYIWGQKNSVHLIDVSKTAYQLERAAKFLEEIASSGAPIMWVGTKKAAQVAIDEAMKKVNCASVTHRWIGGTLTNYPQVKKSVTKLLHYEDILKKSDQYSYTKKERGVFQKTIDRLLHNVGGIRELTWPIGALIVIDVRKEHVAIKEAQAMGLPVVALIDTNCDPTGIDYVIPANDDAPRAISIIIDYLADAVARGQVVCAARPKEDVVVTESVEQLLERALGPEEEEGRRSGQRQGQRRKSGVAVSGGRGTMSSRRTASRVQGSRRDVQEGSKVVDAEVPGSREESNLSE